MQGYLKIFFYLFSGQSARGRGFDEIGFAEVDGFEFFTGEKVRTACGEAAERSGVGEKNFADVEPAGGFGADKKIVGGEWRCPPRHLGGYES